MCYLNSLPIITDIVRICSVGVILVKNKSKIHEKLIEIGKRYVVFIDQTKEMKSISFSMDDAHKALKTF